MSTVVIIQARMGSSRFPGKVLQPLSNRPVLQWIIESAKAIPTVDQVWVATSNQDVDQAIVQWCQAHQVSVWVGSEHDVLDRFYTLACKIKAEVVMRLTADCPLLDATVAAQVLSLVALGHAAYASNTAPPTWPDGLDCEAFTFKALKYAATHAVSDGDREHVTPYIKRHQYRFKAMNVSAPLPDLHMHRWTVDTPEDLEFLNRLVKLSSGNTLYDYLKTLKQHPDLKQAHHLRNVAFQQQLQASCIQFDQSQKLLNRALKTIPHGAQTFSKSHIQYPQEAPLFVTHGQGAYVYDVDGNAYIDLVSGLLPNILGYSDPDVNFAIRTQLDRGITFSVPTALEMQLSEHLCDLIPCAEQVRFAKNGTDVTSAAIRLARAYTQRDHIVVCGYHGWQDWYIGTTTRNKGVPHSVAALSKAVPYNDVLKMEQLLQTKHYAAVIMEPCNTTPPKSGYLEQVKALCEQYGTLLVFDEVVTGFRFAPGGAQAYFKVTPHLACFGKALGNGMPISAIVGQQFIMKEMENIFFSGTFGGEALSLVAAQATLKKLIREDVSGYLWRYGAQLEQGIRSQIERFDLSNVIILCGYAPWLMVQFNDHPHACAHTLKTLFIQEMIHRGILMTCGLNINFAHDDACQYKILQAFEAVLSLMAEALRHQSVQQALKSPVIQPIFAVRAP
jgi:glutamate-1-semialdehyde 2,1-aminomutase